MGWVFFSILEVALVHQVGLEHTDLPPSASGVLGVKASATTRVSGVFSFLKPYVSKVFSCQKQHLVVWCDSTFCDGQ